MAYYNPNSQPLTLHSVFNNWQVVTKGWYITIKSQSLVKRSAQSFLVGKQKIVLFRGDSGKVYALDAFCPHMGVDLGLGKVVGENLQCLFHHWQFNGAGKCVYIPCGEQTPSNVKLAHYAVQEKYGYIWVWPDTHAEHDVPDALGLEQEAYSFWHGKPYFRQCHYHITMINGIDAQHLRTVHDIAVDMKAQITEPKKDFFNVKMSGHFPYKSKRARLMRWLFGGQYAYNMLYAHGTIGFLTMMQDVKLFGKFKVPTLNMLYAYLPCQDKRAEVRPIYITRKRTGMIGKLKSGLLLFITKRLFYLLKEEDGQIYENIQFNTNSFLKIDRPIAKYIAYINRLQPSKW